MWDRANADEQREEGFTLIELMVVVLIIAVLLSIAIPTYFGARERAADRAAQSNVRNAFTATRIYYNEALRYTTDATAMRELEPSLTWTDAALTASSSPTTIFVSVFDEPTEAQTVVVGVRTKTGRCFFIKDVMGGSEAGTFYDTAPSGDAPCPTPTPAQVVNGNWSTD